MSADPSVGAISHLLRQWELCVEVGLELKSRPKDDKENPLSPHEQVYRILSDGRKYESPLEIRASWPACTAGECLKFIEDFLEREPKDMDLPDVKWASKEWIKTQGKGVLLSWFKLLSVGPGHTLPAYGYNNVDVGMLAAQTLPFNPFTGNFWPQSTFALDQPSSGAEYTCSRLLSRDRYLRLDPDVMKLPTLVASMMTINPILRGLIIREIYKQTETAKSRNAVEIAADFLRDDPLEKDPTGPSGEIWGTGWYQESKEPYKEKLREWQAERDAREAKRLSQWPWNPWSAWIESLQNMTR